MIENITEKKLSRKELEQLQRRKDILKAARTIFLEKGFLNTTLDEIAQLAEFGKGTLYNYFSSKEDLLWGLIEQFFQENVAIASQAIQARRGTVRDKLHYYAKTVMALGTEHEFFHVIMRESHTIESGKFEERMQGMKKEVEQLWQIIAQPIQQEMDAGRIKQGDAVQMAGLFDLMIRSFGMGMQKSNFPLHTTDREKTVDLIVTTFFEGVEVHSYKGQPA